MSNKNSTGHKRTYLGYTWWFDRVELLLYVDVPEKHPINSLRTTKPKQELKAYLWRNSANSFWCWSMSRWEYRTGKVKQHAEEQIRRLIQMEMQL